MTSLLLRLDELGHEVGLLIKRSPRRDIVTTGAVTTGVADHRLELPTHRGKEPWTVTIDNVGRTRDLRVEVLEMLVEVAEMFRIDDTLRRKSLLPPREDGREGSARERRKITEARRVELGHDG